MAWWARFCLLLAGALVCLAFGPTVAQAIASNWSPSGHLRVFVPILVGVFLGVAALFQLPGLGRGARGLVLACLGVAILLTEVLILTPPLYGFDNGTMAIVGAGAGSVVAGLILIVTPARAGRRVT